MGALTLIPSTTCSSKHHPIQPPNLKPDKQKIHSHPNANSGHGAARYLSFMMVCRWKGSQSELGWNCTQEGWRQVSPPTAPRKDRTGSQPGSSLGQQRGQHQDPPPGTTPLFLLWPPLSQPLWLTLERFPGSTMSKFIITQ